MLHIDERLAGLAAAAARSPRRSSARRPHPRSISVRTADGTEFTAAQALELIGDALEGLAGADADRMHHVCAGDVHVRTPAFEHTTRVGLSNALTQLPHAFSDIVVSVESLIVSDRTMAAEWRLQARHSADIAVDWALIEATGQAVTLDGALTGHLVENVEGGSRPFVFDDLHLHYDTTSLLVQLSLA
jgi:hypothetical protein